MRHRSSWLAALAVPALLTAPVAAESEGQKSEIEGMSLGEHIYGPKFSLEDLKGRVVLVEFWGIN
jgi:hypothetical protein